MKQTIIAVVLLLFAFAPPDTEKKIPVNLTRKEWSKHFVGITNVENYLMTTSIPANVVKSMMDSIFEPLKGEIYKQVFDTSFHAEGTKK